MQTIVVFGSSKTLPDSASYALFESLGMALAESGFTVATGGYGGIMEAALKGALAANGHTIGVTLDQSDGRSKNSYIKEELQANSYLDRLQRLIAVGDGFIIAPGGSGTLLEFAAVWALKERDLLSNKPIVYMGEQWSEMVQTLEFFSIDFLEASSAARRADSVQDALQIFQEYK